MVYQKILNGVGQKKQFAVLLDPDKSDPYLKELIPITEKSGAAMFLVGGSMVNANVAQFIDNLKKTATLPVVLFPGNACQFAGNADALLLLSLISGRNPEFLIGSHVNASRGIKSSGVEVIPTGYILIDGGTPTSVQYMSNTMPIPASKPEIAVATALAGEQLGLRLIYLEAGSGAINPVPVETISQVRKELSVPLVVGGGLRTREQVLGAWDAGADMVVIGNALEGNPERLLPLIGL
jgi:putative glycerol-1-phosphate prenyltransferase